MSTQFGRIEFWDKRYQIQNQKVPKQFDWYQSYEQIKDVITQFVQKDNSILNIGCGNSKMSEKMFKEGFYNIKNIDWSETVITQMKEKYKDWGSHFTYEVMDARDMRFNNEIDCIIDKGCLDSILCGEYSNVHIYRLLDSIYNSLTKSGVYICISYGQPQYRKHYLENIQYLWTVNIYKIYKFNLENEEEKKAQENDPENFHYIYVCRKKQLNIPSGQTIGQGRASIYFPQQ